MFGLKDKRTFIEKNNDSLLFWEVIGGPLMIFVLSVIIIVIIIAIIVIPGKIQKSKEAAEAKRLAEIRPKVMQELLDKNKDLFKDIEKTWNEDNAYYLKAKTGTFEIRFSGDKIIVIKFKSNSGYEKTIY
jgi:type II secretory pathway pseudopilin PulG